jgi:hypothetical protein
MITPEFWTVDIFLTNRMLRINRVMRLFALCILIGNNFIIILRAGGETNTTMCIRPNITGITMSIRNPFEMCWKNGLVCTLRSLWVIPANRHENRQKQR